MLDSRSLEVISRFKLAILTRAQTQERSSNLPTSNRGKKLPSLAARNHALTPKVVEYAGQDHLVLTNDVIERSNYRNKRRWLDFYGPENGQYGDSSDGALASELEDDGLSSDDDDENPLKRIRISEILAPLTHPAELVTHPAVSKTYKLTCLATMASDLIHLIEVEQNTLNDLNKLLQVLDGEDWFYLLEENMGLPEYDHGLDESREKESDKGDKTGDNSADKTGDSQPEQKNGKQSEDSDKDEKPADDNKRITRLSSSSPDNSQNVTDPFFALPKTLAMYEEAQRKQAEELQEGGDELELVQQDLVNYLQVSIQRQYEYIQNLTTLRNGVVKADRYKSDLLKWGKEMHEKKN